MKTKPASVVSEQIVQPVAAPPKTSRQQLEAYCPIDPSTTEDAPLRVSLRELSVDLLDGEDQRSEEHTSELQSLMRISYAVFCLKKKTSKINHPDYITKPAN